MNKLDLIPNTQRPEEYVEVTVGFIEINGTLGVNGIPTVVEISMADYASN